jgi:hypothetical protein
MAEIEDKKYYVQQFIVYQPNLWHGHVLSGNICSLEIDTIYI